MPTGGFVAGIVPNVRGSGNAGANSIFLSAITAQQSGTVVAVLQDGFSATAVTTLKALIYDSAHSVLLASSAQFSSIAANYNRWPLTTPLSITAGTTYYVGYVCSTSAPVTVRTAGGTSWLVSGGQSVASPANPLAAGAASAVALMLALELDGSGAAGFGFSIDQASGVTLSASNTVASYPSGGNRGARSVITQVPGTGKWYAEMLAAGTINTGFGIGISSPSWGIGQGTAQAVYIYFLLPSGSLQGPAGTTALGLTYASGDVIGIAYDAAANLLWFNKNNGSWFGASSTAGNPATGTGGAAVQSTQWPLTVTGSTGVSGGTAVLTLRDTAGAFQYTPPSGFSAWSAATYPVAAARRRRVMVVG